MEWWAELEGNASFRYFLGQVEAIHTKRVKALVNARGAKGAPMTNDEYHGTAGEARALEVVLGLIDKAKRTGSQESE